VDFQAQLHTLVVIAEDIPGSIKQISGVIAEEGVNIASMYVSRTEKKANMVIELDQPITASSMERIRTLTWVQFVRLVNPIVEGTSRYEK